VLIDSKADPLESKLPAKPLMLAKSNGR
jgi:hypothetical protein